MADETQWLDAGFVRESEGSSTFWLPELSPLYAVVEVEPQEGYRLREAVLYGAGQTVLYHTYDIEGALAVDCDDPTIAAAVKGALIDFARVEMERAGIGIAEQGATYAAIVKELQEGRND